jgi:hypothetical protein
VISILERVEHVGARHQHGEWAQRVLDLHGAGVTREASLLADQQNKQPGSYQHCNQNTDDERNNRMPTGLDLFRSSALLRRSDAQPEE